jgi:hypothetical protein
MVSSILYLSAVSFLTSIFLSLSFFLSSLASSFSLFPFYFSFNKAFLAVHAIQKHEKMPITATVPTTM